MVGPTATGGLDSVFSTKSQILHVWSQKGPVDTDVVLPVFSTKSQILFVWSQDRPVDTDVELPVFSTQSKILLVWSQEGPVLTDVVLPVFSIQSKLSPLVVCLQRHNDLLLKSQSYLVIPENELLKHFHNYIIFYNINFIAILGQDFLKFLNVFHLLQNQMLWKKCFPNLPTQSQEL